MIDTDYPLASLIVVFYKQENFVKDTVEGALSQTYQNLEIIFSDDNSPDNTFEEIKDAVKDYHGPHRIIVNRNEKNMGLVPHINKTLFELSHGEYIFLNGGDDVSLPERVNTGVESFQKNPVVAAITFSRVIIDKNGKEIGKVEVSNESVSVIDKEYLKKENFMAGASALSFRRTILDTFGRLNDDCQTDDSVLRFRSLLTGGILCKKEFGLKYRVHGNNISSKLGNFKTELIAKQYRRDLEIIKDKISIQLYMALTNKIEFYCNYRNIQVSCEQERFRLKRLLYYIQMHFLRLKYLKGISRSF